MATLEERIQNLANQMQPMGTGMMSDSEQEMMAETMRTNQFQPLIDLGFGNEVQVIMDMPMDSPESKAAQRRIIQGMGTGMDIDNFLMEIQKAKGRSTDTTMGHLSEGEVVVPPEVFEANPAIADALDETMMQMGVDPRTRIVDTTGELGGIASINPDTGLQEFFIKKALSKLNRARKKVTKKLAPVVATVAPFIPGVGPLASAAITAAAGKASGLSTKDALLGGALSYGGSKLLGGTPGATSKGGKLFTGGGADGIGRFGRVGDFFGNVKSGISSLFGGGEQPLPEGMENRQSSLGRVEDFLKTITGDDGMTRTQELISAGYTPEQVEGFKADGTFNQRVMEARASGKVVNRQGEERQGILGRIGGSLYDKEQGRLTGLGTAGLAGIAGVLAKLAYDEQKKQKGVPLTPLTTMDALGRYNIESEIARRTGQEMPSRVEFGLTGEGIPVLSGGRPTVSEEVIVQPPQTRMAARGGIMAFADGGVVALQEGGEPMVDVSEFPRKDGQIDGPGTETSDDIPAMLSDGEFVMTAKAVRGAGSYDLNEQNGILTLTPNGESGRDSGTRIMYKLMDHFANQV
jgi:hypothetical protein